MSPIRPDSSVEPWKAHGAYFDDRKSLPEFSSQITGLFSLRDTKCSKSTQMCVSYSISQICLVSSLLLPSRNSMLVRKFFHNVMEAGLAQWVSTRLYHTWLTWQVSTHTLGISGEACTAGFFYQPHKPFIICVSCFPFAFKVIMILPCNRWKSLDLSRLWEVYWLPWAKWSCWCWARNMQNGTWPVWPKKKVG